ncbi:LAMI_0E12596g1_1 [Lachancea mirantina]|uniref:LAMI_0E12596g1_1 n=1 Tax=Lachancea mirantina TaxID=1230905 RepID=A0A1G4JQ55_9SACH|nr:LAMI_0E12596g1_1 [Lachancea mirantina]
MMNRTPLITSVNSVDEIHLLVGTHSFNLGLARIKSIVESGAYAFVFESDDENISGAIYKRFGTNNRVRVLNRKFALSDLTSLGRNVVGRVVDRVFVNLSPEEMLKAQDIYDQCIKLRIPILTFQRPELSTFHLVSTYSDPGNSGLQIAVTTNGQGCLLANRIRREIVAKLPHNISDVVTNVGHLRDRIINEDHAQLVKNHLLIQDLQETGHGTDEDAWESQKLNKLVQEFNMTEREQKLRRSRWLSQIITYYPLSQLAELRIEELAEDYSKLPPNSYWTGQTSKSDTNGNSELNLPSELSNSASSVVSADNRHVNVTTASRGRLSLVGSGPGSVSMLTLGALHEIKTADFILADKLVPETILALIPKGTETFIARKFPGNAERAQEELLEKGLEALEMGKRVVRLKQGDPYIFGRGGEEYLYFSKHGYAPQVLPGLSSALTSTVVSKIPATQRDVADQVLVCTGTGRKGALPQIPEYIKSCTSIFLMALHRSEVLVKALFKKDWPLDTPAAIIERASCPDQRITRTILKHVPEVINEIGSRPPGLLVLGDAVGALVKFDTSRFARDGEKKYFIEEGYEYDQQADLDNILLSAYVQATGE